MLGITQVMYDIYRRHLGAPLQAVKFITPAEEGDIAFTYFWEPAHCAELSTKLSICQFDASYNSGSGRAIKFLQAALGVVVDGDFGPKTKEAVLSIALTGEEEVVTKYLAIRWQFFLDITAGEPPTIRLNGYRNRIDRLKAYLNSLGDSENG